MTNGGAGVATYLLMKYIAFIYIVSLYNSMQMPKRKINPPFRTLRKLRFNTPLSGFLIL